MAKAAYHHGDLRNALIEEAGRMIEEDGVNGLSLRGLARRLGVSHAAPGHHFADREALLCEIAAEGFAALSEGLEKALDAEDEFSVAAGMAYVDVALAAPQRFKLMFASRFLRGDSVPERLLEESDRAYQALLRIARGDEAETLEAETYRMGVREFRTWSMVHGAATLYLDGALGQVGDEEEFRRLVIGMLERVRADHD
ncbi:MAG: WHG domain-containing protein [Acidobacteriota bacterium]